MAQCCPDFFFWGGGGGISLLFHIFLHMMNPIRILDQDKIFELIQIEIEAFQIVEGFLTLKIVRMEKL